VESAWLSRPLAPLRTLHVTIVVRRTVARSTAAQRDCGIDLRRLSIVVVYFTPLCPCRSCGHSGGNSWTTAASTRPANASCSRACSMCRAGLDDLCPNCAAPVRLRPRDHRRPQGRLQRGTAPARGGWSRMMLAHRSQSGLPDAWTSHACCSSRWLPSTPRSREVKPDDSS